MNKLSAIFQLLRPFQWLKNVFLVAPLFFSERLFEGSAIQATTVALLVFCLASSAVYVVNDLCDLEADRAHEEKRSRPIASGQVTIAEALTILAVVLGAVIGVLLISDEAILMASLILAFFAINLCYSLGMKKIPLWEMFMVASGYVIRVIAGSVVIERLPSEWIMVCAGTLSMLIVVGKRREELAQNRAFSASRLPYCKYSLAFLDKLVVVLCATTLVSYLLFSVSEYASHRFGGQQVLLTSVFVAMGVFRYMQIIFEEIGAGSPSSVIVRDKLLLFSIAGWIATFFALIYI